MANKGVWIVVFVLVVTNCLTLAMWFNKEKVEVPASVETASSTDEVVATVGEHNITRQEWLHQLEKLYGKDTLREVINREVIYQLADKYNIKVSDEVIEQELTMIKAMYNAADHETLTDEEEWRKQIEYNLLLEEMLTKDVTILDGDIQKFFKENESLYKIPTTYHLSHITVKTKEEADQVVEELKNGSDFAVLAMEKSTDEFSSNQGGDLGYLSKESGFLPERYMDLLSSLKPASFEGPIQVGDEYAIVYLHEVIEGKEYSYEDVKDHIRRQLALGQIEGRVTAEQFWNEIDVEWFYEDAK
ncbi:peptidyl-prolyl cis-trans isomerase [Bacillus suaedaesalsae]|uniref:peptidylprolyl isomerase n=1 Tax=Bacillus suaedaesalsae TaxID=2810349 RepID=A0ABS2DC96_9BACI|nr:peptidyl-prolyl cis-trans isomerase [Bacillus suaedaesalsae]